MQLILIESVDGLGRPGDKVKVKAGFARNYLLPRGKALPVGPDVLRNLDKLKARAEEEERAMISSMEELRSRMQGTEVVVHARATEEGHLFGSVSEKDIQESLERSGWKLPPRAVRLEHHHLKEAGSYEVDVHLYGEIGAQVKVEVVPVDIEGNPIEIVEGAAERSAAADEGDEDAMDADGEDDAEA